MMDDFEFKRRQARAGHLFIPRRPKMREESPKEKYEREILEMENELGKMERERRRGLLGKLFRQ